MDLNAQIKEDLILKMKQEKKDCLQRKNTVKDLEYTYVHHVKGGIFQQLVNYD